MFSSFLCVKKPSPERVASKMIYYILLTRSVLLLICSFIYSDDALLHHLDQIHIKYCSRSYHVNLSFLIFQRYMITKLMSSETVNFLHSQRNLLTSTLGVSDVIFPENRSDGNFIVVLNEFISFLKNKNISDLKSTEIV